VFFLAKVAGVFPCTQLQRRRKRHPKGAIVVSTRIVTSCTYFTMESTPKQWKDDETGEIFATPPCLEFSLEEERFAESVLDVTSEQNSDKLEQQFPALQQISTKARVEEAYKSECPWNEIGSILFEMTVVRR